jgi:hypothetical protein
VAMRTLALTAARCNLPLSSYMLSRSRDTRPDHAKRMT